MAKGNPFKLIQMSLKYLSVERAPETIVVNNSLLLCQGAILWKLARQLADQLEQIILSGSLKNGESDACCC